MTSWADDHPWSFTLKKLWSLAENKNQVEAEKIQEKE